MNQQKTYAAIDLKSFYASVECVERGLDPLAANLVVADESRTEKTICLAVSPALKAWGIGGRARLFEVVQRVAEVNRERLRNAPGHRFSGKSADDRELRSRPELELDFVCAQPRMAFYIDYSTRIYDIYLKYVAPEDIHVYSIDEVFIDLTEYLRIYGTTPRELTGRMMRDVLSNTGITATAGIGTNLYLAKVAMDIVAKHLPPDGDGLRIAEFDEMGYRRQLWGYRPLTDFWRVGRGIAERLRSYGIDTMGKLARASLTHEELLYREFGINAELLIDHAWGWEPCTMADIKSYTPESSSISSSQVLAEPYTFEKARNVAVEMADALSLELVERRLVAGQIVLDVNFDRKSLENGTEYRGPVEKDYYGRIVPKHARDSVTFGECTSSGKAVVAAVEEMFDRAVGRNLLVRRLAVTACRAVTEEEFRRRPRQLDLFADTDAPGEDASRGKERRIQETMLDIRRRFGKNAILKGINYEDGATGRERNRQIGGHKA